MQDKFLDQILRETHGNRAVNGFIIWSAWSPQGYYRMCLTDNNFRNLVTGNVVDRFLRELAHQGLPITTDSNGILTASLYHGVYEAEISHSIKTNSSSSSMARKFTVVPRKEEKTFKIIMD